MNSTKKITVIICSYKRHSLLEQALGSLLAQDSGNHSFDVVVVNNCPADDISPVIGKFFNSLLIKYVVEPEEGLSFARNRGIKEAATEYLAFLDDDAKADAKWISTAISIIKTFKPRIFGGPIYPFYLSNKPEWFLDNYEKRQASDHSGYLDTGYLSGSNIFFQKCIFEKLGYFDTALGMKGRKISVGEETKMQKLARDYGVKIFFDKNLIVYHLVSSQKMNLAYLAKRFYYAGYVRKDIEGIKENARADIINLAHGIIIVLIGILRCPFRDKSKFPCWKNYYITIILPNFIWWGNFYRSFRDKIGKI